MEKLSYFLIYFILITYLRFITPYSFDLISTWHVPDPKPFLSYHWIELIDEYVIFKIN